MANRYGEAALTAVRMETYGKAFSASDRWVAAVQKLYPTSVIAQRKSAPRLAFFGLCRAGLIAGIGSEPALPESVHGVYAVKAAKMLLAGKSRSVSELWAAVTDGEEVPHASQMDVVLALWKNGLLAGPG